jgi:hypothetical protein
MSARDLYKKAFTMPELLIISFLTVVVFAAGLTAITYTMRFYLKERQKSLAIDELNLVFSHMEKDTIRASSFTIDTSTTPAAVPASLHPVTPPTLVLTVPDYISGATTTVAYSVTCSAMHRTAGGAAGTPSELSEMIDASTPPIYATHTPNCLYIDIQLIGVEANTAVSQRSVFMSRCRNAQP